MRKSWLDRSLAVFTDVRAGEGVTALLLAANIFSILAFYSVLKVVRDALVLAESGAVVKSYSAAGQALLLLAVVPLYGAFASRVNRIRLVCTVTLFFASHLVVFAALGWTGVRVGVAFFLWAGIFNLVVISQFWAFANDLFSSDRGKRLFPLVGLGASLGAFVGAGLTFLGFKELGAYRLMLLAAVGLVLPTLLTLWVHRREHASGRDHAAADADRPLAKSGGFQLVLRHRYLLLIALLMIGVNLVNTLGGFLLDLMMKAEAQATLARGAAGGVGETELIGTMKGGIDAAVNLLALLLQAFLVSRILKYVGVRGALYVLPLVALASYSLMAWFPIFTVIRIAKILENSTDYSVQNTARHALFLPTSREAKYKAKQAIDAFFVRFGDFLQAVVVYVGTAAQFTVSQFALVNILFALVTLGIVTAIGREHQRMSSGASQQAA
jgi:AAA family ATP:ADP antiporter